MAARRHRTTTRMMGMMAFLTATSGKITADVNPAPAHPFTAVVSHRSLR